MSGDPEQEFLADGMVEEIVSALSRVRSFFVISRNSTFAYKGRAVDPRQVGRELGVRYLVEGSVRRAGNRLRVMIQLLDASTGSQVWSERHDGEVSDVFDLQDKVTEAVVGQIAPTIRLSEVERAKRKRPDSLDAYDYINPCTSSSMVRRSGGSGGGPPPYTESHFTRPSLRAPESTRILVPCTPGFPHAQS